MEARNAFAQKRHLNQILNDADFMQYLSEMFTTDDDGTEHPELLRVFYAYNEHFRHQRVLVSFSGNENWRDADGYVLYCTSCGEFSLYLFPGTDGAGSEVSCQSCGVDFSHVAGYEIER